MFQISQAQISFTNGSTLLPDQTLASGAPVGIADINDDSRDDIVILNNTTDIHVDYQNSDGTFTEYLFGNVNNNSWALMLGDVDNNGFSDWVTGGSYNGVQLTTGTSETNYTSNTLTGASIFVQASSFVDINNDGCLDLFMCHDDGANAIWTGDCAGNLSYSGTTVINFNLYPDQEDNSGNYGAVWTDFDGDCDLDLYVSKCRINAVDITDVRRINQLWVNDGNGNFTENAAAYGLADGGQSWVSDFQDIDNDGDLDCFIANHDIPSVLWRNNGDGTYTDITNSSGLGGLSALIIQTSMKDFDNDGYVDLLMSGNSSTAKLFHNNGDNTFTLVPNDPLGVGLHTFAIGDVNQDHFLDVYAGYGDGYNGASPSTPDNLWLGVSNHNNKLSVRLVGQASNRDAIGAWVELHGVWGTQIREVRAGESYGISHSHTKIFGMGTATDIDSLVIKWPSGLREVFTDVLPNQMITVKEGVCISPNADIASDGHTVLCTGGSVNLEAPAGYAYQWSTGETTQSINVNTAGDYKVTVTGNDADCFSVSDKTSVIIDDVACADGCLYSMHLYSNHPSNTYATEHHVRSHGIVPNSNNVTFEGGSFILLEPGFEVQLGGEFLGHIQACTAVD